MKNYLAYFFTSLFLISFPAFAAPLIGDIEVTPIVGLERVQKVEPTPHTRQRAFIGVRVLYGPPLMSAEAEVTKADDTEEISGVKYHDESYAAKLGIRSAFGIPGFRFFLRAGGHARQSKMTKTEDGVSTVSRPALRVSPYAGTGIMISVLGAFTMNAGADVIFTGEPKGSDREYQYTLGFGIRI